MTEGAPATRNRLSAQQREWLKQAGFASVYVVGPLRPVPRRFGDNAGGWPVRVGVTSQFADGVGKQADSWAAFWWQGVLTRVWVESDAKARRLAAATVGRLEDLGAEHTRHSWLDIMHATTPVLLEMEIFALAEQLHYAAIDDEGVMAWADKMARAKMRKRGG